MEGERGGGGAMAIFGHGGGGTSVGPKTASTSRNQSTVLFRSNHSKTTFAVHNSSAFQSTKNDLVLAPKPNPLSFRGYPL